MNNNNSNTITSNGGDLREQIWDYHSSEKWVYFAEEDKRLISHFLSERLSGKRNLELGGGWYLSHPGSTVLDLSSVALEHNPAKHKVQFDLDTIKQGKKLPFPDHSFDSATMISVWQYLRCPALVLEELRRVLIPGGKLYVINLRNAWLQGLKCAAASGDGVYGFLTEFWYDCMLETIPWVCGFNPKIQSVCASMPEPTLFEVRSVIRERSDMIISEDYRTNHPYGYYESFMDKELHRMYGQLCEFSHIQVSDENVSMDEAERYSWEFFETFGIHPIIISSATRQKIATHGYKSISSMEFFQQWAIHPTGPKWEHDSNITFSKEVLSDGYLHHVPSTLSELAGWLDISMLSDYRYTCSQWIKSQQWSQLFYSRSDKFNAYMSRLNKAFLFAKSIPLTTYSRELQARWREFLQGAFSNYGDILMGYEAYSLFHLCTPRKQVRPIDTILTTAKEKGLLDTWSAPNIPIFRTLEYFREFFESDYSYALINIREWDSDLSDGNFLRNVM